MQLVEGSTHREGRVEVCVDGRWGTVSTNSQEGIAGPGEVCNKLGFPAEGNTNTLVYMQQYPLASIYRCCSKFKT